MLQTIISYFRRSNAMNIFIGSSTLAAFFYFVIKIKNKISSYFVNSAYNRKTNMLLAERNQLLQKFIQENHYKVPEKDQKIIQHSHLLELREHFLSGKYTSEQITLSLLLRAASVGVEFGYLSDVNIEETLKLSREADVLYAKIKEDPKELSKLPFLGLPLSIKESIPTAGFRTTLGYAVNASKERNKKDCYFIEVLRKKGAIPLVTTNVPQGLIAIESQNSVYGKSLNPFCKERTTGGSTGGEAGLIRQYCSAAGIGSDIGGSIRIPCNFSGIYGFKPSALRISRMDMMDLDSNIKRGGISNIVNSSLGPMARSVSDLVFIMKNLFGEFSRDTYLLNKKFSEKKYEANQSKEKVFKIGYIVEMNWAKTAPPIVSVMEDVINTLKNNDKTDGYKFQMEEFSFSKYEELYFLSLKLFASLGNFERILNALKGEDTMNFYLNILRIHQLPRWSRGFISKIFSILGRTRESYLLSKTNGKITLKEYLEEVRRLNSLKDEFYNIYQSQGFDALITPVTPFLAPHHGDSKDFVVFVHFNLLHNFLDLPSGVIPIRKAGKIEKNYSDKYNDKYTDLIKKNLYHKGENLPIGLQIATLTNEDEACLALMKVINNILIKNNVIEKLIVNKDDEEYETLQVDNLQ
jgi:fatty acid amide hydrolase